MVSDAETDGRLHGVAAVEDGPATPLGPSTPQETGPQSSHITLPSTEIPGSPLDPGSSFKTEVNDDRPSVTVIPSSLTPPPSTQVLPVPNGNARRTYSQSQQSLFSPPATVLNTVRDRRVGADYVPPQPNQVLEASADDLRAMLQTCIAEQQKLKMETAHHKLQFNLLNLQAEDDSKRAAVEHDMVRREVDALRMAEHKLQAKRELSTSSDSAQAKYLQMKMWYESAVEENEGLGRRLQAAKKVIQQKEEETIGLTEERDMLLNRIRENREHFHMLCSPGGIFHNALTPKQPTASTPQQHRSTPRQAPRSTQREDRDESQHGLSALLQAMSQDNTSAPSTPLVSHRAVQKHGSKHTRNAQSMSSLPTTPRNRIRDSGLLPAVDLVPQTEPRSRYASQAYFAPATTPPSKRSQRRKSRESTISADDNEELARQAVESVAAAAQSLTSNASRGSRASRSRRHDAGDDEEVFDSQASQAATEMLRRDPRQSFEVASSAGSRDMTPPLAESFDKMQKKHLASTRAGEKRKFGGGGLMEDTRLSQGSPKKAKAGGSFEGRRVGLGIQYS